MHLLSERVRRAGEAHGHAGKGDTSTLSPRLKSMLDESENERKFCMRRSVMGILAGRHRVTQNSRQVSCHTAKLLRRVTIWEANADDWGYQKSSYLLWRVEDGPIDHPQPLR